MTAAARAAGPPEADDEAALVAIRPGGAKPALFCVHAAEGHLRLYGNLARHLDSERSVYGFRGVMREGAQRIPYVSFEEMAQRYLREILELQPEGPYIIVGECDGGQLAYELAQQLRSRGADVPLLVLIDSHGPGGPFLRRLVPPRAYVLIDGIRMLGFHLRALAGMPSGSRRGYLSTRLERIRATVTARARGSGAETPEELVRQRAFREALTAYRPAPYSGRVAVMRGRQLPWGTRPIPDLGWGGFVADLELGELPCYFGTSLLEPPVRQLAAELAQRLDAAASKAQVKEGLASRQGARRP